MHYLWKIRITFFNKQLIQCHENVFYFHQIRGVKQNIW